MNIRIHPHTEERMKERGASRKEVKETVRHGQSFPAKFGRTGFKKNFVFEGTWRNKIYSAKKVEAYCEKSGNDWIVVTIMVKYF